MPVLFQLAVAGTVMALRSAARVDGLQTGSCVGRQWIELFWVSSFSWRSYLPCHKHIGDTVCARSFQLQLAVHSSVAVTYHGREVLTGL